LILLSAMHAGWAFGASWPCEDRAALADAAIGRPDVPGTAMCLTVSSALAVAAYCVGAPRRGPSTVRRLAASGVVVAFAGRGALGLIGRTDVVSRGSNSPRFRSLDRRVYSPVCLAIATLAVPAARA